MPSKKHKPEEIIGKLREAEIVLAQGASTAEACRPLLSGPKSMLFWIMKEVGNAIEKAQAGGDYRQAA